MNKQTAVEWLVANLHYLIVQHKGMQFEMMVEKAKAMEREQHGETWDAAIKAYRDRGHNVVRAIVDFDEYWANKSKTPPGEHCEEA